LARLLNWIAVIMLVVLGAGGDHSATSAHPFDMAHYQTGAADRDGGNETLMAETVGENAEAAVHCGAPMLGLGFASLKIFARCTAGYVQRAAAAPNGNRHNPDPRPPRLPRLA
jgi:hypothetical protein